MLPFEPEILGCDELASVPLAVQTPREENHLSLCHLTKRIPNFWTLCSLQQKS
jgi:hypothetical protein